MRMFSRSSASVMSVRSHHQLIRIVLCAALTATMLAMATVVHAQLPTATTAQLQEAETGFDSAASDTVTHAVDPCTTVDSDVARCDPAGMDTFAGNDVNGDTWTARWPLLALQQSQRFDRGATINQDNRLYRFHDWEQRLELRPELRYIRGGLSVELSPRAVDVRSSGLSDGERWRLHDQSLRMRFGRVQYARGNLSARAGRYVNLWGPSVLVSPSNPFHVDSGQTSPQTELAARDYLESAYAFDDRFAITAIANFGEGDQSTAGFRRTGVVRVDYTGDTTSQSALLIYRSDSIALGGYGQWTPNDSWVLYWDGLIRQGRSLDAYPRAGRLVTGRARTAHVSLLLGAAYSFTDGTTLSLEGYRNGSGLRAGEREALFDLQQHALSGLADPLTAPEAAQTLSHIAGIPLTRMGRDYGMLRLQRSNLWDRVDLGVLYLRNLDDRSQQTTLRVDWYATDNLQAFAYWTAMQGRSASEYGRFFDNRLIVGVRWSLW
jgi:hypothetical protein